MGETINKKIKFTFKQLSLIFSAGEIIEMSPEEQNNGNKGYTPREKIAAIKELLSLFKMERTVYLIVTLLSVTVLLTCAIVLLIKRASGAETGYPEILGLFGSSGSITYSTGRLLKMWSDALQILSPHFDDERA